MTRSRDLADRGYQALTPESTGIVSVKDFGAVGDGVTDDTAAIDTANAEIVTSGGNLFFPQGTYIYNGAGLSTTHYVRIYGEGSKSILDASSNTNSGFLITMSGNRTRLEKLELRGNPSNSSLRGVQFTLNQEDSGGNQLVLQDWHYGLELNRLWYCGFSDISFRNSAGVTLTGSHINIGDSYVDQEVNNIQFDRVYLLGSQDKGVSVNCYTQGLTFNECSFECSGTRIQFNTASVPNTTTLNGCYIEGTSTSNGLIASSANNSDIKVYLRNCLIRMEGDNSSVMFEDCHGYLKGCHGGSPTVLLSNLTGHAHYVDNNSISTRDNYFVLQGGSWNNSTEETNFERYTATPKRLGAQEYNCIIPKFVHQKTVAQGAANQPIFAVYLPADGSNQRKIRLDLKVTLQATTATPNVGQDHWSLLFYQGGGVGSGSTQGYHAMLVSQDGNYVNAGTVTLTLLGYNSVTDSQKYLIDYSPDTGVYGVECFFELEGTFHNSSALEEQSWPWRIEKI